MLPSVLHFSLVIMGSLSLMVRVVFHRILKNGAHHGIFGVIVGAHR